MFALGRYTLGKDMGLIIPPPRDICNKFKDYGRDYHQGDKASHDRAIDRIIPLRLSIVPCRICNGLTQITCSIICCATDNSTTSIPSNKPCRHIQQTVNFVGEGHTICVFDSLS